MSTAEVIESLTLASETCTEALRFLLVRDQANSNTDAPLPVLHKDLLSLLSLVHASTTKLALVLKPSSPSYSASLNPLKDITLHVSGLARCASLFDSDIHGATLIQEITFVVKDVIESVRSLTRTFLAIETNPLLGTVNVTDEYMIRTGAVHDLIDKARGENGVSQSNIVAVRKKWAQDWDSLDDGLKEVSQIIEEEEMACGDEENELVEDGWDELGLGSRERMSKEEIERTKTVHTVLRLTTLLHKRVSTDFLSSSSPKLSNHLLDSFSFQSSALLSASDELISTLYAPQDSSATANELTSFLDVIRALQALLGDLSSETQPLGARLDAMSINEKSGSGTKKIGTQKWFDTCFQQIQKATGSFVFSGEFKLEGRLA